MVLLDLTEVLLDLTEVLLELHALIGVWQRSCIVNTVCGPIFLYMQIEEPINTYKILM